VSKLFGLLSDDDVRQIALLAETLDQSTFDFLQLEVGDVKLTLGKGAAPTVAAPAVLPAAVPALAPLPPTAAAAAPAAPPSATAGPEPASDGTLAIVAPTVGLFYACPEPGAAPFVSVGATVAEDSTVGLIEVMKVFSAVPAGLAGIVTEVCIQDCTPVEYGQVLFRVRPA